MNIFKLIADLLHLAAIFLLVFRIRTSRNCVGISYKTQELFLITFSLRYLDLFMYFISLYNTCMKLLFVGMTAYTVYLIRYKKPYCRTYNAEADEFPHRKVILPAAAVLALLINSGYEPWELVWSFSLWLEALAFIPQIVILNKIRLIENITSHYVAALGLYRFFYVLSWLMKYFAHDMYSWTQILSGVLQTAVYADLLYYYFVSLKEGKDKMELPLP